MNDIEVLENIITEYNTQVEDYKFFTVPVRLDETDIEALENAIKSLKERQSDKERIEDLEEKAEVAEWKLEHAYSTGWKACEIISVPKSLIKEKIEEIEEKMKYEENEKVLVWLHKQKQVLEELLKGE